MDAREHDPILIFTKGDELAAAEMRKTLQILRDHHPDPVLARKFGEALEGRVTLRELSRDPEVQQAISSSITKFSAQYDAMTPEQREEMRREGEHADARLRAELED